MKPQRPQARRATASSLLPVLSWLLLACLLAVQTSAPQTPVIDPLQAVQQADGGALALDGLPRQEVLLRQLDRLSDPEDLPDAAPPSSSADGRAPLIGLSAPCPPAEAAPARFQPAPLNSRAPPILA